MLFCCCPNFIDEAQCITCVHKSTLIQCALCMYDVDMYYIGVYRLQFMHISCMYLYLYSNFHVHCTIYLRIFVCTYTYMYTYVYQHIYLNIALSHSFSLSFFMHEMLPKINPAIRLMADQCRMEFNWSSTWSIINSPYTFNRELIHNRNSIQYYILLYHIYGIWYTNVYQQILTLNNQTNTASMV